MLHISHLELIVNHSFRKALKAKNIRTLSKKRGKIQKPSDIRLVILLWLRTMCEAHKLLVMMKLLVLVHRLEICQKKLRGKNITEKMHDLRQTWANTLKGKKQCNSTRFSHYIV